MWKKRGLTLLGYIQIVKTLIVPKFMSKAALISVSNDLIKEINKLIYGFIWKGNDKSKDWHLSMKLTMGDLRCLP